MRILDANETIAALPYKGLISALATAFQLPFEAPLRHHHFLQNTDEEDAVLLLMPAWFEESWGGVKLVNVVPGNGSRGLAAISSSYVLFDRTTGEHKMILDGAELTARRTAAASALGASKLARLDSRKQVIVGAGRVGSSIPYAYREVLPIEEVTVFDKIEANAQRLVDKLNQDGFAASVSSDFEADVASADVITCATLAKSPVLHGSLLKPGQHVDLIGSFTPEMREVDDVALQASSIYVDTNHAVVESGDLSIPLEKGAIARHDILGGLSDLCKPGASPRVSSDEITLFKAVGTAVEDLAGAVLAFENSTG